MTRTSKASLVLIFSAARSAGAGVQLGQDLLDVHAALAEGFAVQQDGRHGHDLARLDLGLEQRAVDGDVGDARVQGAHGVQRLHHVGAVLAGLREIGLEAVVAVQRLDPLDDLGVDARRVAADVQQGQHQRGELVAQGQAGEADVRITGGAGDGERRLAGVAPDRFRLTLSEVDTTSSSSASISLEPGSRFHGGERGDQRDRLAQVLQIGFQLGLQTGVQHGALPKS
jgi:hypothetical protein